MNGYEKILKIILDVVRKNQSSKIELGYYKNGGIATQDLVIPPTMVYKLDFLDKKRAIKVSGNVETGGGGESPHTHNWTDTSDYIDELKEGDLIAYQQINATKYLIIGRIVK